VQAVAYVQILPQLKMLSWAASVLNDSILGDLCLLDSHLQHNAMPQIGCRTALGNSERVVSAEKIWASIQDIVISSDLIRSLEELPDWQSQEKGLTSQTFFVDMEKCV
jgi:hypothetical protein